MSHDRSLRRHLTPSLFISLAALLIALSSGAYAVTALADGEVKTRHLANGAVTTIKLGDASVTSAKVKDGALKLHDLGGKIDPFTVSTGSQVVVAANTCAKFSVGLSNPLDPGVVGSLVTGYLTDANGGPVMDNFGTVVPTVISETSQGGAVFNLMICAQASQTIPAGSVFHVTVVGS